MALFSRNTKGKVNSTGKVPLAADDMVGKNQTQAAANQPQSNQPHSNQHFHGQQSHSNYGRIMGQSYLVPFGASLPTSNQTDLNSDSFLGRMDQPAWTNNNRISRSFGATIRLARTQGLLH